MTASAHASPTLLALDIGLRRTGVAVGNSLGGLAQPAGLIGVRNGRMDWQELDRLIERWQPQALILGDPQSKDPALNKLKNRVKSHVQQHHKIPIIEWNEAYTTESANAELVTRKVNSKNKVNLRDQIAACLILDAYLDSL
ncbi:MAG: Holliday junction resolvase RuvX [Arenicella sp.]|nr:Holliday junction resolvase RuvX [Arenicella sp.]